MFLPHSATHRSTETAHPADHHQPALSDDELQLLANDPDATVALLNYLAMQLHRHRDNQSAMDAWLAALSTNRATASGHLLDTASLVRIAAEPKHTATIRQLALTLLNVGSTQTVYLRHDDITVTITGFTYLIIQHLIRTARPVEAVRSLELFADLSPPQAIRLVRDCFDLDLLEACDDAHIQYEHA